MEVLLTIHVLDLFTNLKEFVGQVIQEYHSWVYLILFVIIFCETGFVVTPFLPGDSLLFVGGCFAASGQLHLSTLIPILCLAPLGGDSTNYWIGRFVGPKVFSKEHVRFLNKEYLNRAHAFYERHGGKAVAIGRFLPIIRTFVPFVAGIGKMNYPRFLAFSVIGTVAWIDLCVLAGYFFGGHPFVQKHFELVVVAIIVISLLPAIITFLRQKFGRKAGA
ncbi:MAG: VTT domain-containing protein [Phycisphaerae bacterium]|jgi:membrane-associated protein